MDTKESNSNLVKGELGGTDVKTIDMTGTNMPGATNTKSPEERAKDIREINAPPVDHGAGKPELGRVSPSLEGAVPAKKVKFNLTRPITNNGIDYDAGDTLELKESVADFLEKRGNGRRV